MAEPGCIDLDHAGRAKRLQITIDATNNHEQAKHSSKRGGPENNIHHDRSRGSNQHRFFSADMVCNQPVDNLAASVREEHGRDDLAHLRTAESKLRADRFIGDRQVVPAHIK